MSPIKGTSFANLTVTDLRLIARAQGLTVPDGADREHVLALLVGHEVCDRNATQTASGRLPRAQAGWWTPLSVAKLRAIARAHNIDVPAGMRRHELIALLEQHDVPRP